MNRLLILVGLAACAGRSRPPRVLPDQLVTAVVADWTSTQATMRLWQRDGAAWRAVGEPWRAVIGHGGAAWGLGLHGAGAPPGRTGPVKREGDGASPAGMFGLVDAFGYSAEPPAHATFPYMRLEARAVCVDDPASSHYGRILDRTQVPVDWKSAEVMRRDDELYRWVITVDHNGQHRPGAGSCIFLHVWAGPDATTVGCTAMAEPDLARLIAELRAAPGRPAFVLLPRAEYAALAAEWGLPPL